MSLVLLAIGLVLVLEGLVFALAPSRLEEMLELIARMPVEMRRLIGLLAITLGAACLWGARLLGL